jgi:glyceraldehyde 3-phosphate dehydrogenase
VGRGPIEVTAIRDPAKLPWGDVDIVMECTGIFTDKEKASIHLDRRQPRAGLRPGSGRRQDHRLRREPRQLTKDLVVSNASCTTNCLAPVAHVLNEAIGIEARLHDDDPQPTPATSRRSTRCTRISTAPAPPRCR